MARPVGVKESKPRRKFSKGDIRTELGQRLERLERLGVLAGTSRRVLAALQSDRYWLTVIDRLQDAEDWRAIAEILRFHQQMDEGRPAQRIQLTSFGIQVTAEDLEQARAVVRELRGTTSDVTMLHDQIPKPALMLLEDEGSKNALE